MAERPIELATIQTCIGPMAVYIGRCCREWIMLVGQGGRCGLCGEQPRYERPFVA